MAANAVDGPPSVGGKREGEPKRRSCRFDPKTDDGRVISSSDWLDVCKVPKRPYFSAGASCDGDTVSREWFVIMLNDVITSAELLGKSDHVVPFKEFRNGAAQVINENAYDVSRKSYRRQAEDILALWGRIVPGGDVEAAAKDLDQIIMDEWDGHSPVGFIGARYISSALSDFGYSDAALHLWKVKTCPS